MKKFLKLFLLNLLVLFAVEANAFVTGVTLQIDSVTCNGLDDGRAYVSSLTSTGTGPYSFRWTKGATVVTDDTLTGADPGVWLLQVYDSSDMTNSPPFLVSIGEPGPLIIFLKSFIAPTCFGDCDGTATVTPVFGNPPYTYLWDDPLNQDSSTAIDLCVGTYRVTVTDQKNCSVVDSVTLTEPAQIQPNITSYSSLCFGDSTATAKSNPISDFGGPFTYNWDPDPIVGDGSDTVSELIPGDVYSLTVTDGNGCSNDTSFTPSEPAQLIASLGKSDVFCNGDNNGSVNASASGGTTPYTFNWDDIAGTPQNRPNVFAGDYTVTVTDANGCTDDETITVNEPSAIQINFSTVDVLCNGASTGEITASVSGGIVNYSFDWSNGSSGNLNSNPRETTISSLAAGTYTITIHDGLDCEKIDSVTITEPTAIAITVDSTTNPTCTGGNDGEIFISVTNGTPGLPPNEYTYSWAGPGAFTSSNQDITSLVAGTYTVTVTDANNCTQVLDTNITDPAPISPNVTTDSVTCIGGSDGSASVAGATGGTLPYTYEWAPDPLIGDSTDEITGLSAGTYHVTITDANGCTGDTTFTVGQPATGVDITNTGKSDVFCFGETSGSITNSVSGGTPPYTFSWSDNLALDQQDRSNIGADTYTVTVTDNNGCTDTETIVIGSRPRINISFRKEDNLCIGDTDGRIVATITGGTLTYTYNWSTASTGTLTTVGDSTIIDNLAAGMYTITITDGLVCEEIDSIEILEPTEIDITFDSLSHPLCNGDTNGSINISVSGGTPGLAPNEYTYSWTGPSGPFTTQDISNLLAGTYALTVTDANNCTQTFDTTLVDPAVLTAPLTRSNTSCNGGSDGYMVVSPTGGTPPYTYDWNPGAPNGEGTDSIFDLSDGAYFVVVTDANGCTTQSGGSIDDPAALVANITVSNDPSCSGVNDGLIAVQGTGGTGDYTYNWGPGAPNGNNTDTIRNLMGGTYFVTITDANGCTDSTNATIVQPTLVLLTIDSSDVLCNNGNSGKAWVTANGGTLPYTYRWSDNQTTDTAFNLSIGTYTVTVTDANGCNDSISIGISEPSALTATITSSNDPACNNVLDGDITVSAAGGTAPYTYLWNDPANQDSTTAINLGGGTFTVTVTDANGCTATDNETLTLPDAIVIDDTITHVACFNDNSGAIDITVSGGTGAYTYAWSDGPPNPEDRTNLFAGPYFVTVRDANGCSQTKGFTVNGPSSLLTISTDKDDLLCNGDINGKAWVTANGGDAPYTYDWDPGLLTGDGTDTIRALSAGTYTISVTDANGCMLIDSAIINEPTAIDVPLVTTDENCDGSVKGTATASPTDGTPPYTYNWGPGTIVGQGTNFADSLDAGNYFLTVSDLNGCTNIQAFTINTDIANFTFRDSIINDSCFGECQGFAGVFNISGGTAPYSYAWSGGGSDSTKSGLCATTHTVTITDANGCDSIHEFTITEPLELVIDSINTEPESCNPANDGEAEAFVSGGTMPYTYAWEEGGTNSSKTDYEDGDYDLTVTDANGCSVVETFTIEAAAPFETDITVTDNLCFGDSLGEIDLRTFIRVGPLEIDWPTTFQWDDIAADTNFRDSLAAGDYRVTITGVFGCVETHTIEVGQPDRLSGTITTTTESCSPGNDGEAVATITGGVPPYTYNWELSGPNADTKSDYTAGTYTVEIVDANGCDTTISFTIGTSADFDLDLDSVDVLCFGDSTGSITLTTNAGNAVINWSDVSLSGTNPTNLAAGTYTVTVTDSNNCSKIDSISINQPSEMIATVATTDASCNPGNDGTAKVTVTGGTIGGGSDYTYTWPAPDIISTTDTASSIASGTYTVTITDDNACTTTATFTINDFNAPILNIDSVSNVLCFGSNEGYISVFGTGGTRPFTYRWNDIAANDSIRTDLTVNTYRVTLTDANGCTDDLSFNITQPASALTLNFTRQDEKCFGQEDGTINLTISGGTPYSDPDSLYRFIWSNDSTSEDLTNLGAGTYTVTVNDSNNCTIIRSFTVTSKDEIQVDFDTTNILCNGASTGRLAATASDGSSPYTYQWIGGAPDDSVLSNQLAGVYTITITDTNGCVKIDSAEIIEPDSINPQAVIRDESCDVGNDGSINVSNMIGGTPPYTYLWTGGSNLDSLTGLAEGVYSLQVTDANNCVELFDFEVGSGSNIEERARRTPTSCFGVCDGRIKLNPTGGVAPYTFDWDNQVGPTSGAGTDSVFALCAGNYEVTITDFTNCSKTVQITVDSPDEILANLSLTDEGCRLDSNGTASATAASGGSTPYTYLWSTGATTDSISNLPSGSYSIIITDATGCADTTNFTINSGSDIDPNELITDVNCFGDSTGEIALSPNGGLAPYTYDWDPNGETTSFIDDLEAGDYTVTITDAKSCFVIDTFNISENTEMTAVFTIFNTSCAPGNDGRADIDVSGGFSTGSYNYNWSDGIVDVIDNSIITSLSQGNYTVTVQDDLGCEKEFPFTIDSGATITLNETIINQICSDICNGSIELNPSGGTAPYTYEWSTNITSGQSTNRASALCADTYNVTVTDNFGCTTRANFDVTKPDTLIVTLDLTNESCQPSNDGRAIAQVTGGTVAGDYTYTWSVFDGLDDDTLKNLVQGNYGVTVEDDNGCRAIESFSIGSGGNIVDNDSIKNATCHNGDDGKIFVTPTGGTAPYSYNWSVNVSISQGQGTDTAHTLTADIYTLTITDAIGCELIVDYNLDDGDEIFPNLFIIDENCNPGGDGQVFANAASGGVPPLTFNWSIIPDPGNVPSVGNLAANTYTLTITDSLGCTTIETFDVESGNNILANDSVTDAGCFGSATGQIGIDGSGGVAPYTYGWANVPNGSLNTNGDTASSLPAGTYTVTISDAVACFREFEFVIDSDPEIITTFNNDDDSCSAGNTGIARADVSGGVSPYTFDWENGASATNSNVQTGYGAGSFSVTITDNNGCSEIEGFSIGSGSDIIDNEDIDSVSCANGSDGQIALSPSGGVAPYTYNWSSNVTPPSLSANGDTASQLSATDYTVTITDVNGCSRIESYEIFQPSSISASVNPTDASCASGDDGRATASGSGGTSPLTFNWSNGDIGLTADSLGVGNHDVTITDANGCDTTIDFSIGEGAEIRPNGLAIGLTCNGICDGIIALNPSGGVPPYTFDWETGITDISADGDTAKSLCADNYRVTITDRAGCVKVDSFDVGQPEAIEANLIITDASCAGGNGIADASGATGGTGILTFSWAIAGGNTDVISGRPAGDDTLTITDSRGCSVEFPFTIGSGSDLINTPTIVDVNCFGDTTGEISLTTVGGTSPYTYAWDNKVNSGGTTSNPINLGADTYEVTVTDFTGCSKIESFTVNESDSIEVTFTTTDASCDVGGDGQVTASVSGGTSSSGIYTFSWPNKPSTTDNFDDNLADGNYCVTITDDSLCSVVRCFTIGRVGTSFSLATSKEDASCNGGDDGFITVEVTGGTSPYTYLWDSGANNQTTDTAFNLSVGTYTVTVTDAAGCSNSIDDSIQEPSVIIPNLTTTNDGCNAGPICTGNAKVSPTGGVGPYTYDWEGPGGSSPNGDGTDSISLLCSGRYRVTISDANSCDTVLRFFIDRGRTILPNEVVQDEDCNNAGNGSITLNPSGGNSPYTYTWSNGAGNVSSQNTLSANTYTVTIADLGGCDTTLTIVINTTDFDYSISKTDLSCSGLDDGTADITIVGGSTGFSFNWDPVPAAGQGTANISDLSAQEYKVTITDPTGCTAVDSVDILPNTTILDNSILVDESCSGGCDGEITLSASGGAGGPYTYSWADIAGTPSSRDQLCAGTYTVTITDVASCTEEYSYTINDGVTISANIGKEDLVCGNVCDGRAFVSPSGGSAPYSFEWSPNPPNGQFTDTISSLCTGSYDVTITDANGCTAVDGITINGPAAIGATFNTTNSTCNICDGSIVVTANGGDGNFTYEWLDATLTPIGNTSDTVRALCSGVYYVDITDGSGCSERFNTNINDNGSESLTASSTDVNCYASNDGTAEVDFNCSDPNCSVVWFNTATTDSIGNTNQISGLAAGNYYAQVTNNSGCKSFVNVTIDEPAEYVITSSITNTTCNDGANGSITISVSGSNGDYTYTWGPGPLTGQGTNSISNLTAGTYEVTVSDSLSCDTVLAFVVGEPIEITAIFTYTEANCGQADGSIESTINGGTVAANYEYQWFDAANNLLIGETNPDIFNIAAGSYDLRVTDDNTCQERFTAVLANLDGPTVVVDSTNDSGCFGSDEGAIYITASGTNTPFTYNWLSQGQTSEDIQNLSAGVYTIQVTDALGCIGVATDTINEFAELNSVITTTDASCGQCNGKATAVPLGRIVPYTYLWSNGSTADSAIGLCSGVHTLQITDGNGCTEDFTFSINTDGGPTGETVSVTATSCATSCDGSVTITPRGGTLPYTYLWQHNGATTNSLNDLCKGTYFLQISDAKGCSRNVRVDVDSPNELEINELVAGATCGGSNCDGSILLTVNGGNKPYTYTWGPTAQSDTNYIDALCAGVYNVTVSDANGCTEERLITVSNEGSPITADPTIEDASCNGTCDGSLISNLTPSVGISYVWLNDLGLAIGRPNTDLINTVCAGKYILQVTSLADGCVSYAEVEVVEPDSITLSASIVKNISCAGACDGEVFVSALGGTILFSYTWNDPNRQDSVPAVGLCAGTYQVTATDANGCIAETSVTLEDPTPLNVIITSSTNLNCSSDCNATATSTASGGTEPYTFEWDGGQTGENPIDLCFGPNILTVTDAIGCSSTDTVFISATDTVIADAGIVTPVCEGDSITLSATATGSSITSFAWYLSDTSTILTTSLDTTLFEGIGNYTYFFIATNGSCADTAVFNVPVVSNPMLNVGSEINLYKDQVGTFDVGNQDISYTYVWDPPTALTNINIAEPTTSIRENITYTLTVTDTNNCQYVDSVQVNYFPELDIPSGLSPNADGVNDQWKIGFLDEFPDASVMIFNRWGELIYEQPSDYNSNPWDGTYEGKELPIGTYYYIIDFKDPNTKPITGPITIIR